MFDPKEAKQRIKNKELASSEVFGGEFSHFFNDHHVNNKGFVQDEYFLRHSDEICDNKEKYLSTIIREELQEKTIEKCFEEGEPFTLAVDRQLNFDLKYDPPVTKEEKICKGHHSNHSYYWKNDAKENKKKRKKCTKKILQ